MNAHQCARDAALLEDLAVSGAFPDIVWQRAQAPGTKKSAVAVGTSATQLKSKRSKTKKLNTLSFPLHAPSTTIRQTLFPTGPGSYPSPTMSLQQPPEFDRQHYKFHNSYDESNWAPDSEQQQFAADNKRRETGWNTSFPAEYAHGNLHQHFQQTLAYQEHRNRQRDREESMAMTGNAKSTGVPQFGQSNASAAVSDRRRQEPVYEETDCGAMSMQSPERLALLKEVTMREGLLVKLTKLVDSAVQDQDFGTERGNELLHLLLQLRDASVQVMQAVANWHASLRTGPCAFCLDGKNYIFKMVSDLNFLARTKSLGKILGVSPAKMKRNPFMMPAPIPERDFYFIQSLAWSRLQRQFLSLDPVERVASAEKYLVWCLYHLADPGAGSLDPTSPPHHPNRIEKNSLTWQERAEKQLQMLSMPLEAPTDRQTHIMDSSRMMKRKGYLPSLSLSPAKTLTELIGTVQDEGGSAKPTIARRLPAAMCLQAFWNGVMYSTSSGELEELGWMENPPHHMVTLVAASVLILLSPSDRIPKDLSWTSCRKMLLSGSKLVDRMDRFEVASVPPFKLKALVPFLQNDHFQPKVLCELSRPAGVLCAWVLASLAKAQSQEVMTSRSDEDRLDILGELEVEEGFEESQSVAATPLYSTEDLSTRPKTPKRVTIGNAEVLFINESQPAGSLTPRPASQAETPLSKKKSRVMLRTSPWTFRGVTYFVSFFVETAETAALSIKLYEPMSSVESQIFVSEEDLAEDFGASALESFQTRDYRSLCDLILSRLDDMLTSSKHSGREQQLAERTRDPVIEATKELDKDPVTIPPARADDLLEMEQADGEDDREASEDLIREREAVVDEEEEIGHLDGGVEESVLRIQCAARQRMARDRVARVRFEQETTRELARDVSAVRIQSVARQRLAKNEVARLRVENRRGTGIPSRDLMLQMKMNSECGVMLGGDDLDFAEKDEEDIEEDGDKTAETQDGSESEQGQAAVPPPAGHFGVETSDDKVAVEKESERPETVMSYASDQFEDDDF